MMVGHSLCLRGRVCLLALAIVALAVSVFNVHQAKVIMGPQMAEKTVYCEYIASASAQALHSP